MLLMACYIMSNFAQYTARGLFKIIASRRALSTTSVFYGQPNIVVYAGDNEEKFEKINKILSRVLSPDSVAVYQLNKESLLKNDAAWLDNVRGIFLDNLERLSREEANHILNYFKKGGKVVDFGSNLCKHIGIGRGNVLEMESENPRTMLRGSVVRSKGFFMDQTVKGKFPGLSVRPFLVDENNRNIAIEVHHKESNGKAVLSRFPFHLSAKELDISENDLQNFEKNSSKRDQMVVDMMKRLEIVPKNYEKKQPVKKVKSGDFEKESVYIFGSSAGAALKDLANVNTFKNAQIGSGKVGTFDSDVFFKKLSTKCLGNTLIYQSTTETTMDLVKEARWHLDSENVGLLAVCDQQTKGFGRAGNKWLSPPGCAMFTFQTAVDLRSGLGRRIPLVQSLVALSLVTAIKEFTRKDLDIKIKWPNDIYYNGTTKIGGILVQSTMMGERFHCSVGVGINLSNEEPTLCLDKILKSNGVPTISREELIARTLNRYEQYAEAINKCQINEVIGEYCENWLHSGQRVVVREECQTDYNTVPIRRNPPPPPPHGNIAFVFFLGFILHCSFLFSRTSIFFTFRKC